MLLPPPGRCVTGLGVRHWRFYRIFPVLNAG
jgi:hypothetical protein